MPRTRAPARRQHLDPVGKNIARRQCPLRHEGRGGRKDPGPGVPPGSTLRLNREDAVIPVGDRDYLLASDSSGAVRLCFVYEDFPIDSAATSAVSPGRASLGK
jgi:hypothetical protein